MRSLDLDAGTGAVQALLLRLGVTANYAGFYQTAYAVHLAAQQPDRLLAVTKNLYPDVAGHFETTWQCVERNIRTTIQIAWRSNQKLLEQLARRPLPKKLTASEFLAVLAWWIAEE